jgi:hypothetical protein
MDYIGIDLHKTSSQVPILTEDSELIEPRIKTDKESFDKRQCYKNSKSGIIPPSGSLNIAHLVSS